MFRLKISKADKYFSLIIRSKANWTCELCFTEYEPPTTALHCSHFWGRGNKGTRWDEENAAALCFHCHQVFTANPELHRAFFLKRLGEKKYEALGRRARTPTKVDEKLMALGLKIKLEEMGILKEKSKTMNFRRSLK